MPESAAIRVDGRTFAGWTSVEIGRSLDQACASFSLVASARFPGQANPAGIRAGSSCEILLGDEVVITGHVDAARARLTATEHAINVTGRSKTADLVDCSAVTPARWRNRTIAQIAADLAAPFGVDVAPISTPGSAFARFAVEPGETVHAALERAARSRGLLVTDDAAGRLVLTTAGSTRADVALVEGENVLTAEAGADASAVFSTYIVRGQRAGTDEDFGSAIARVAGQASDVAAPRHRPLVIIAEGNATLSSAKARAEWEAAVRLGKSTMATIQVQGWRQRADGRIWTPGELVDVDLPSVALAGELLIVGVTLTLSADAGTLATLSLSPPDAYRAQPPTSSSRGASGLWREIAAGVTVPKRRSP